MRESIFWFPSTQGRQNGRASGRQKKHKKRETAWKRSAGTVDDQNWSKIARSKKTQFSPPRNERVGGRKPKKASLPVPLVPQLLVVDIKINACFFEGHS